jgi:hypothetical protein
MPKTAVALFENSKFVEQVIGEAEVLGFPRNSVRVLGEPLDFAVHGIMSIPEIDFELELIRELERIGATKSEAEAYAQGVRHGGVLVFATGPNERVDAIAESMNRYSAIEIEETQGPEPQLPSLIRESSIATAEPSVQTGRIRHSGGGASLFVW